MLSKTFTVVNPQGFHVRPTKAFVDKASTYPCKITVVNKGKRINGKSSLGMLSLGIKANEEVTLEIDGDQEEIAMEALGFLLSTVHD